MGYRSDVYICIKGARSLILNEIAKFHLIGNTEVMAALAEWNVTPHGVEDAVMVLGSEPVDWKWYPDYPDVKAHMSIFGHFQDMTADGGVGEETVSGAFIRIGEDDADVEMVYFGQEAYELGSVRRSIDRQHCGDGDDLRTGAQKPKP